MEHATVRQHSSKTQNSATNNKRHHYRLWWAFHSYLAARDKFHCVMVPFHRCTGHLVMLVLGGICTCKLRANPRPSSTTGTAQISDRTTASRRCRVHLAGTGSLGWRRRATLRTNLRRACAAQTCLRLRRFRYISANFSLLRLSPVYHCRRMPTIIRLQKERYHAPWICLRSGVRTCALL